MIDILLTNDDGYRSAGFLPLLRELSNEFSVVAIAPDEEKSWIGKAISSKNLLKLKKVKVHDFEIFTINGTPADCVQIGLFNVLESFPKMVVSGINQGVNVGHARILSSGTIGATMEASIEGVHALASSIMIPENIKKTLDLFDERNCPLFKNAVKITTKVARILLQANFDEDIDLFSMNIPFDAKVESKMEITKPFRENYGKLFYEKNGDYVLTTPDLIYGNMEENTDLKALSEGSISLTPIQLDLCVNDSLKKVEKEIISSWQKTK